MNLLVTGGTGFIASHTCLSLLKKGYEIYIIDSYQNSSPKSLEKVKDILLMEGLDVSSKIHLKKGDLREKDVLIDIFQDAARRLKPINGVIHFAGLKSVSESINLPIEYWYTNLISTINLVKVMDQYNCNLLVFSSSATIYEASNQSILNEECRLEPSNPYGNTKFVIEKFLNDVFKGAPEKWKIGCLRYFNPVGSHYSGLIGESPVGIPNNLFPIINKVAIGDLNKLEIFGNDWPTIDGTPVRDYIHVMDLADGHISALDYLNKSEPQCINLNLGTGVGTSVLEFLKIFQEVNSVKVPFVYSQRREGDKGIIIADNKKAMNLLNWIPKRTIEDISKDGWKWQKNNPNGYK